MKKDEKTSTTKKAILSGSLIAGAILGLSSLNAQAAQAANYKTLGSGSELRTELLGGSKTNLLELSCGAKKDSTTKAKSKTKDGKCGEGKCGEGKCGAKKGKHAKKAKTAPAPPAPKKDN